MGPFTTLSDAEREIMDVIWRKNEAVGVGELTAAFADERGWKMQTVSTFLTRLTEKGILLCKKQGAQNRYWPAVSAADYRARKTRSFLEAEYGGSVKNMLAALYDTDGIDREELAALKRWFSQEHTD